MGEAILGKLLLLFLLLFYLRVNQHNKQGQETICVCVCVCLWAVVQDMERQREKGLAVQNTNNGPCYRLNDANEGPRDQGENELIKRTNERTTSAG